VIRGMIWQPQLIVERMAEVILLATAVTVSKR